MHPACKVGANPDCPEESPRPSDAGLPEDLNRANLAGGRLKSGELAGRPP